MIKLKMSVAGMKFSYTNNAELIFKIEKKLGELDEKLDGFEDLRKKRRELHQALKQLGGHDAQVSSELRDEDVQKV